MPDAIWSVQAEEALLGGLLCGTADLVDEARRIIPEPTAFFREAHQCIYRGILALTARRVPLGGAALQAELEAQGSWDRVGFDVLADLSDGLLASTAARVRAHAETVVDRYRRRELIRAAQAAQRAAEELTVPLETAVSQLVAGVAFGALTGKRNTVSASTELWEVLEEVERQASLGDVVAGIASGMPALDALTDGWMPGRLIVLAARPKCGKSALGIHCAELAAEDEKPVFFASAEMPRKQILRRRLSRAARTNLRTMASPDLWRAEARALHEWGQVLLERPFEIDQDALTATAVRLGAQRVLSEKQGLGLVVVDYLGKLRPEKKTERHDLAIGQITGDLARVAVDLNVPVLLLCQLNRASVKDGHVRRPVLSDLRDSGAIEQDADQVVFLWQDPARAEGEPRVMELDVAANRHGPSGRVEVEFERDTGWWGPRERRPTSWRHSA